MTTHPQKAEQLRGSRVDKSTKPITREENRLNFAVVVCV